MTAGLPALTLRHPTMHTTPLLFAIAVLVCLTASPVVQARGDDNLPAAVNRVERETGGQVLSAERRNQSGREVNRIKVYTPEGRVRVMWEGPKGPASRAAPAARAAQESQPQERRSSRERDVRPAPVPRDRR